VATLNNFEPRNGRYLRHFNQSGRPDIKLDQYSPQQKCIADRIAYFLALYNSWPPSASFLIFPKTDPPYLHYSSYAVLRGHFSNDWAHVELVTVPTHFWHRSSLAQRPASYAEITGVVYGADDSDLGRILPSCHSSVLLDSWQRRDVITEWI